MVNISQSLYKEYTSYSAYKDKEELYRIRKPYAFIKETEINKEINFICDICKIRKTYLEDIIKTYTGNEHLPNMYEPSSYFKMADYYYSADMKWTEALCKEFLNHCRNCKK